MPNRTMINKPEHFPETIWIAEVYLNDKRIERIVHLNEDDAHEEMDFYNEDEYKILVEEERLFTGEEFINND